MTDNNNSNNSNNNSNASPSPITYSQVVANGQSTMTLTTAIVNLVGQPISSYWSKHASVAEFRAKLGEWASEAVDPYGHWMQPVLKTDALRDHLIDAEACPVPSGRCTSSYGWAQLLYALGISPGMKIVSWRVPPKGLQPGVDSISLVIDGAALCHIINLFRCYDGNRTPLNFSYNKFAGAASSRTKFYTGYPVVDGANTCAFAFGTLAVDSNWCTQSKDKRIRATFEPGTQQDLSKKKIPFPRKYYSNDEMEFEQGPFMGKYWAGMESATPIKDGRGIGLVPPLDAPLRERIEYYVRSTQLLDPNRRCESQSQNQSQSQNATGEPTPRLVTYEWLECIARIKRRATTDGGANDKLLDYLFKRLLLHPGITSQAPKDGSDASRKSWEMMVRGALSRLFLFAGGRVEIRSDMNVSMDGCDRLIEPIKAALVDVVGEVSKEGKQSQFANLVHEATKDGLLAILNAPHIFTSVPVYIMELGRDHILWKSAFEIE